MSEQEMNAFRIMSGIWAEQEELRYEEAFEEWLWEEERRRDNIARQWRGYFYEEERSGRM